MARSGMPRAFFENACAYKDDDCLMWPFAKSSAGRPNFSYNGKVENVSRRVCIIVHGQPPTPRHEAAHNCGKMACVNPSHLRWATSKENHADKTIHGTTNRGGRNGQAILSADDVRQIRRVAKLGNYTALGKQYGVSQTAISEIMSGRKWGWLT